MTFTEKFLDLDLTAPREVLLDLFMKSIYEIRSEELGTNIESLEKYGDTEAAQIIKTSSIQEVCLHTDDVKLVDNVPEHAQKIVENYNKNNAVTVFRGTRLPLANSSFNNGFVHTTPQFATSAAYAVGISNGYGGIGRLLTKENESLGLGFIHAYDAPLHAKTYKNFQFERFLNGNNPDSEITLENLKQELENFAKLDKDSFSVKYASEQRLYGKPGTKIDMSENMQKWYDFITSTKCMETQYYEVMLPEQSSSKYTFLMDKDLKLVKLDLNNPKTQKVLDKLQGLLLKDFYEVVPLDKLVKEIEDNLSTAKEDLVNVEPTLLKLVTNESVLLKELKDSVLSMLGKIKKESILSNQDINNLMRQSAMVGSTNMIGEPTIESKVKYHHTIEDFILDVRHKKQLIEQPLEQYFKSFSLPFNKQTHSDNSSLNLLDKLLNKIIEKNIPESILLKKIDTDVVMLDFMRDVENKLKLEHIVNPTICDFVNRLHILKETDLSRQYIGKNLLTDKYVPFIQFIGGKTLNQYITPTVHDNADTEYNDKGIKVIAKNITSIRSKLSENKKAQHNPTC